MDFLQQALFPPDAFWLPPTADDLPSDWNAFRRIGLDTETNDAKLKQLGPGVRRGAYVAGISFAISAQRGFYLPLRHFGGDNVADPKLAVGYIKHQAKRFTGEIVGANLSYDIDFLLEMGIEFPLATFRDVLVAEPLLDELQYSYSLDNVLTRRGLPNKDEGLLRKAAIEFKIDPKKEMWKLPARYVGAYAEADACRPLALLEKQDREIDSQGIRRVWDLESALLPVLVRMRRRGVAVDFDRLDRIDRWSQAEERKAWGEVQRETGVSIKLGDAMKAEVLAPALQAAGVRVPLGAPHKTTGKVKPSITKDWLATLETPVAGHIRRARQMSQLRSTFVGSIREHQVEGRIHCTFNQVRKTDDDDDSDSEGGRYGRLSCVDPNLQQQPARDPEIGPMWRAIYRADAGGIWCQNDYSQQEPRWAVHFAVVSGAARISPIGYRSACEARDRYINDRSTDAHTLFTQMVWGADVVNEDKSVFKKKRDDCKQIFLGICYGMGGPKLCRKVGLPTKIIEHWKSGRRIEVAGDEGQALLDLVNERAPYVKKTAEAVEDVAKQRGFVRTVLGRVCRFPLDEHGNPDWTFKAFNRVIQGSSADQMKQAMVECARAGAPIQLQVHDEMDLTVGSEEEGRRYAKIMEECVECQVPAKVDAEFGPSWGEVG